MKKHNQQGFGAVEYLIITIVVAAIGFGAWYVSKHGNKTSSTNTSTPASTPQVTTSERPNKTKFNEFFTAFSMAKLAAGQSIAPPDVVPVNTNTFYATDQLCANMTIKKAIAANSLSTAFYDVVSKQNVHSQVSFPQALPTGGTSGCSPMDLMAGKYEYKVYIDNVLVVDTPFTVTSATAASCIPKQGEAAFSGKVAYADQYKQYILQTAAEKTYYLQTTDEQSATLKTKLAKNAQVNGSLRVPGSADVIVATVCP